MALNWDDRLRQRGVILLPDTMAKPGDVYWKLIDARYLDEAESGGRHTIFVELWNEQGRRMVGVPVRFYWKDGEQIRPSEAKPNDGWAIDFPMHAPGNSYGIEVADGRGSDGVWGMGLGTVENRYSKIHVCYSLRFQLTVKEGATGPGPQPNDVAARVLAVLDRAKQDVAAILLNEGGATR